MQDSTAPNQTLHYNQTMQGAHFFQKSEVVNQLTKAFCHRFSPPNDVNAIDPMVLSAQNCNHTIGESLDVGKADLETHSKLINTARSSLRELIHGYHTYLQSHLLTSWTTSHPRFVQMQNYCKRHNHIDDYAPYFGQWNDEEMANTAITLCHQIDTMLGNHLRSLQRGLIEPMPFRKQNYHPHINFQQQQETELTQLRNEVIRLKALLRVNGIAY